MASPKATAPILYNQSYERISKDLYETPVWCSEVLCDYLKRSGIVVNAERRIWEPACGKGKISEVLMRYFGPSSVYSTDISYYGYEDQEGSLDFLEVDWVKDAGHIATNPPFSLAEEFVRHALRLTETNNGIVCMLLRQDWDAAKTRNDLFTSYPFCRKITLTTRPRWFPYKKGDSSPQHSYAWLIWDWKYEGKPEIEYGHKPKGEK